MRRKCGTKLLEINYHISFDRGPHDIFIKHMRIAQTPNMQRKYAEEWYKIAWNQLTRIAGRQNPKGGGEFNLKTLAYVRLLSMPEIAIPLFTSFSENSVGPSFLLVAGGLLGAADLRATCSYASVLDQSSSETDQERSCGTSETASDWSSRQSRRTSNTPVSCDSDRNECFRWTQWPHTVCTRHINTVCTNNFTNVS